MNQWTNVLHFQGFSFSDLELGKYGESMVSEEDYQNGYGYFASIPISHSFEIVWKILCVVDVLWYWVTSCCPISALWMVNPDPELDSGPHCLLSTLDLEQF